MLIRFSIENFLSFNDRQTFSMIAGRERNNRSHIIPKLAKSDVDLLKLGVVFGPNASGKSNLIKAMDYMVYPGLKYLYGDDFWKLIGEKFNIFKYIPEVIIEHRHGFLNEDETHKITYNEKNWNKDVLAWADFLYIHKENCFNLIQKSMFNK